MPPLSFGLSSYERAEGSLPPFPVVNMYAEQSDSEGVVLQSRPGLDNIDDDMGAGPVRALYRHSGVLSGALIGASGSSVYNGTTSLGSLAGTGVVSIAGNELGAMIAAGSTMRYYNGTTLANVAFPDSAAVTKVLVGGSRFIALRAGGGKFYWTDPLGTTFTGLNFATAEGGADILLDALFVDDILILFGAETVEFWPNTTDSVSPFVPLEGRVIERGIKATGCASPFGPSFAWVTNHDEVCFQDENNIISNEGLQAKIAASASVRLFVFFIDGLEFLALRLDTETQVYNRRTGTWTEFASNGQTNFAVQCYADGVFGSALDGKVMEWGGDKTDALATDELLERLVTAGVPINGGGVEVNSLQVRCNPGQTPYTTGDYATPEIALRVSRDAGQTWGAWRSTSLGTQGQYGLRVMWRALGIANQPGFICQIRVTDPVPFRLSGVFINEQLGGR